MNIRALSTSAMLFVSLITGSRPALAGDYAPHEQIYLDYENCVKNAGHDAAKLDVCAHAASDGIQNAYPSYFNAASPSERDWRKKRAEACDRVPARELCIYNETMNHINDMFREMGAETH